MGMIDIKLLALSLLASLCFAQGADLKKNNGKVKRRSPTSTQKKLNKNLKNFDALVKAEDCNSLESKSNQTCGTPSKAAPNFQVVPKGK